MHEVSVRELLEILCYKPDKSTTVKLELRFHDEDGARVETIRTPFKFVDIDRDGDGSFLLVGSLYPQRENGRLTQKP